MCVIKTDLDFRFALNDALLSKEIFNPLIECMADHWWMGAAMDGRDDPID